MIYNETSDKVNKEWYNTITNRSKNGKVKIHSKMIALVIVSNSHKHLPFNKVITAKIEYRIVVAASDASLKDG